MYVTRWAVEGLRGAEVFLAEDLDRIVELPTGPAGVAVADALEMFAMALDGGRVVASLTTLGLLDAGTSPEVLEEEGFPVQIGGLGPVGVSALLPTDGRRQVTMTAVVQLDPPLFGRLRQEAVRDPRLVTALGSQPRVSVKVGWAFTRDLTAVSVSVLSVHVGDTPFSLIGNERPNWLSGFLRDMGSRWGRVRCKERSEVSDARWFTAATSHETERRRRFRVASEVLSQRPFRLGSVEWVRCGDLFEIRFGTSLLRKRQFGSFADAALDLVEAVILDGPDVLLWEAAAWSGVPASEVRAWIEAHVSGDRATLEQIWIIPGGAAPVESST